MGRVLLLDLEGVLIESWEQPDALHYNIERIKQWMQGETFDAVGLMSYAIHNERDYENFVTHLREPLQSALGIEFDPKWNVCKPQVLALMRARTTLKLLTEDEFDDYYSRKDSTLALLAINGAFRGTCISLIDDTVANYFLMVTQHNTEIRCLNINNLPLKL